MPKYKTPEILTEEISDTLLQLTIHFGYDEAVKILNEMPNPPSKNQINFATKILEKCEILIKNKISNLGDKISKIPLNIQEAITLLHAAEYGVTYDICIILAMIAIDPILMNWFMVPNDNNDFYKKLRKWESSTGEVFIMLDIFRDFNSKKDQEKWCKNNYLQYGKLLKAKKQYYKIKQSISSFANISEISAGEKRDLIKDAFMKGYSFNIATQYDYMYEIDRPIKFIAIQKPRLLTKLGKKILYLDIQKINNKYSVNGIINL